MLGKGKEFGRLRRSVGWLLFWGLLVSHAAVRGAPALAKAPFVAVAAEQHQQAWAAHLKAPVQFTNSIGMRLALIPPGEFDMGSSPADIAKCVEYMTAHYGKGSHAVLQAKFEAEGPARRVQIGAPFYLGVFEVTQTEFARVMGRTVTSESRLPAQGIGWREASEFCQRLSALPAERAAHRAYRLPSEAEWEYACRAGNPAGQLGFDFWYASNSKDDDGRKRAHPVGEKSPNPWGLHDMLGNVAEWCGNAFGGDYFAQAPVEKGGAEVERVVRGGSFYDSSLSCRPAWREGIAPDTAPAPMWGLRVCCSVAGASFLPTKAMPVLPGAEKAVVAEKLPKPVSPWEEDLDLFAKTLPARHKNFSSLIAPQEFERRVAELKREAARGSDAETVLGLVRLVAGFKVAHTTVSLNSGLASSILRKYPIRLQWFADGLAVVGAEARYREALGSRVLRFGALTPEQVEAAVAPYIGYENPGYLRVQSTRFMAVAEVMIREKIAAANGHLQLTCAKGDRHAFTLDLAPMEPRESDRELVMAADALHLREPLSYKQPRASYWYEYLSDSRVLYIQYNKCKDDPARPFAEFVKALLAEADAQPVRRVVVDLRFNGGGSSPLVKPLIQGLKARPALSGKGHLFALIGPHTFSSAVFTTADFRNELQAILVGEPTGNKPNHFGEVQSFVLPNSGVRVQFSTKQFTMVRNGDPSAIEPDVLVAPKLDDFLAGRDPVLEAALRYGN